MRVPIVIMKAAAVAQMSDKEIKRYVESLPPEERRKIQQRTLQYADTSGQLFDETGVGTRAPVKGALLGALAGGLIAGPMGVAVGLGGGGLLGASKVGRYKNKMFAQAMRDAVTEHASLSGGPVNPFLIDKESKQ